MGGVYASEMMAERATSPVFIAAKAGGVATARRTAAFLQGLQASFERISMFKYAACASLASPEPLHSQKSGPGLADVLGRNGMLSQTQERPPWISPCRLSRSTG
jgi:hypothetical protein